MLVRGGEWYDVHTCGDARDTCRGAPPVISNVVIQWARHFLLDDAYPADWLNRGEIERCFRGLADQPLPPMITEPNGRLFQDDILISAQRKAERWQKPDNASQ